TKSLIWICASSTTTAKNTTITPSTPKSREGLPSTIPASIPLAQAPDNDRPLSRPTTPKPSAARKKLHNIFGVLLRKSSRHYHYFDQDYAAGPPAILRVHWYTEAVLLEEEG
ncbi:hypothetical protein BDQ12DRAFT_694409, partial [Crucibulum laeve]